MPQSTDLNVAPIHDDYDPNKKYARILFRPQIPVQARELTQMQSIQQNQIEIFGGHVFKDGSVLEGCSPQVIYPLSFVRVKDNFTSNTQLAVSSIDDTMLLVGATSNVRAVAVLSKTGRETLYPATNRFYVKYLNSGVSGATTFSPNETINIYSSVQNKLGVIDANNFVANINVIASNSTINAIGTGYGLRIQDGKIYQRGFFQKVDGQLVLVREYDQNVGNMVVGFDTVETIVTEEDDESLLDNALGYPNENAPGAWRLKLNPVLVAKDRADIANNSTFFTVFEFSNIDGTILQKNNDPVYNNLGDVLAGTVFDHAGDFVTKPFNVETIEHDTDNTKFNYVIDAGKAYVHGRKVEYLTSNKLEGNKATTTETAVQQITTTNYGNYVVVKEALGSFDGEVLETVALYDTPQAAITNRRFLTSALGTQVGTAQVRTFVHESGTKGSPDTTYLLYLFNIKMNAGKSFTNDVKSFWTSDAVADSVLISGRTILQESSKNNLVFPTGKNALKRLRSANGTINRTQFVTRLNSYATLQANGFLSVTLDNPPAGGTNQLNYSVGVVGDALENDFTVVLNSNVQTANLTGTVSVNTTSTTVTGTSTTFNTLFSNDEFIALKSGATVDIRRIVSVTNSTSLTLDSAPSFANTTGVHAKFYPAGYIVPLNNTLLGSRTINVTSNTTFQINTGLASGGALTSTSNTTVHYKVLRTQAVQASKNVNKGVFVKLYANAISAGSWNLGIPDVLRITNVYSSLNSFSTSNPDIKSYFSLDNGQRDDTYDHARLVLNPRYYGALTNEQLLVKLDVFTANTSAGIGFFSVDSYPIDDANTANSTAIQTASIPVYTNSLGNIYDLRDCIDFRTIKPATANLTSNVSLATLNPATGNTFTGSSFYLSEPDSNFETDMEYYLPRYDIINMNAVGGLSVVQGVPSTQPRTPAYDTDSMALVKVFVPPYPSLSVRENALYNRRDYMIRTQLITNRGYTMRDIGVLDQRISRLEYYVTLNMLEQKAANLQVPDSNGLNRFKNGIFVDPFNSHAFGDTTNFEYKIAIDQNKGIARPTFKSEIIDLAFSLANSTNVQLSNNIVTLPYTDELIITQPFATKTRNAAGDFWSWSGNVDLYPSYDMARDELSAPNVDASIDLTQPFLDFANAVSSATGTTIFGTRWGDWRTLSTTSTTQTIDGNGSTTTTTFTNQEQLATNTFIVPVSNQINLGRFVTDVSVQPYIRSREIAFVANNLKPNTRMYVYFDTNVPVSQYCAPGTITNSDSNDSDRVTRTAAYGTPLYTDANGRLVGKFLIPASMFRTGDRTLIIVDVPNLESVDKDAFVSKAFNTYTASNISVTSKNLSLTTKTPTVSSTVTSQQRTVVSSTSNIVVPPVTWDWGSASVGGGDGGGGAGGNGGDPLAQTFTIERNKFSSGVFGTKLRLYFKKKDPNLGLTITIVGTTSGKPDITKVMSYVRKDSASINVSDDASVYTEFNFPPFFIAASQNYAFIISPEGNSPEYLVWMSEIGGTDVITGAQIYSNPYIGNAFRSSNIQSWTDLQTEDIKFDFYVANFTDNGTAVFYNDADDYITFDTLSLANNNVSVQIGDAVYIVDGSNNITNTAISAIVENYDPTNGYIKLDQTTGGFAANTKIGVYRFPQAGNTAQANSTTLIATANVAQVRNPASHAIVPRLATVTPLETTINVNYKGTSNSAITDTSFVSVPLETEKEFYDYERLVYSKSNELTAGIAHSLTLTAQMNTNNKYLSPIIDLSRKAVLSIENIINNDSTNENTRYGNALAKYLCSPIELDDGQDAEDLLVRVTAYRPYNTDVEVYCKLLSAEDNDAFENKEWTKMVNNSPEVYSVLDPSDFREYKYTIANTAVTTNAGYKNQTNLGIVQYTDTANSVFVTYKQFAIKIVPLSTSRNVVPLLNDVQAIALQV